MVTNLEKSVCLYPLNLSQAYQTPNDKFALSGIFNFDRLESNEDYSYGCAVFLYEIFDDLFSKLERHQVYSMIGLSKQVFIQTQLICLFAKKCQIVEEILKVSLERTST